LVRSGADLVANAVLVRLRGARPVRRLACRAGAQEGREGIVEETRVSQWQASGNGADGSPTSWGFRAGASANQSDACAPACERGGRFVNKPGQERNRTDVRCGS